MFAPTNKWLHARTLLAHMALAQAQLPVRTATNILMEHYALHPGDSCGDQMSHRSFCATPTAISLICH